MNVSCILILLAVMCQAGVVLADKSEDIEGYGKPNHGASRDLGGWTSSSKSHKSGKSTDSPTLFPTQSPTLFPTMSPTYCGKSSKSSWWSGSRRLHSTWTSTSKSAKSCWKPSSKSSWRSGGSSHSRRSRDKKPRDSSHHNFKKKRNGRDLKPESKMDD